MAILILFVFFVSWKFVLSSDLKRLAFVFSYHEDYGSTSFEGDGAVSGLVQQGYIENLNLEIKRYYMNSKTTNNEQHEMKKEANQILEDIKKEEYDVIATFDDNAFIYVGLNVSDVPVVFTGLNGLPDYYNKTIKPFLDSWETPGHTITGVYEKIYIIEALQVMSIIVPEILSVGGIVLMISDNTTTGQLMKEQVIAELAEQHQPNMAIQNVTFVYETVDFFEDFETLVLNEVNQNDSIIAVFYCVFSLKTTITTNAVSSNDIYKWVFENSVKPDLSSAFPFCEEGLMGGVGPDYFDMGRLLGIRAGRILNGEYPGDISIGIPHHEIFVNLLRTDRLGIEVPETFTDICTNVVTSDRPAKTNLEEKFVKQPIGDVIYVVFGSLTFLLSLFCFAIVCCFACLFTGCCCSVFSNTFLLFCCTVFVRQSYGLKRFKLLKNFDFLLKEQELDDDTSIAHLKINKKLFEIQFEEIRILGITGEGGSSSIVFRADWNGQEVAFKCFRTRKLCSTQDKFDEFEREVEILGSLSHPSIIQFYGATIKPPRVGIVMEFASKGEILEYVTKYRIKYRESYPISEKLRIISQVISGMEFLHGRNIIHRDLKCANVLLDEYENSKIMDFGLSRMMQSMDLTKTQRIGTNVYIAPEVVSSSKYTEKVDVFSFAILIYVLLTEIEQPYGEKEYSIELRVSNSPDFRPDLNFLREALESLDDTINRRLKTQENNDNEKAEEEEEEIEGEDDDRKVSEFFESLIVRCWNHDPKIRYSFKEIREVIEEKFSAFLNDDHLSDDDDKVNNNIPHHHNNNNMTEDGSNNDNKNNIILKEDGPRSTADQQDRNTTKNNNMTTIFESIRFVQLEDQCNINNLKRNRKSHSSVDGKSPNRERLEFMDNRFFDENFENNNSNVNSTTIGKGTVDSGMMVQHMKRLNYRIRKLTRENLILKNKIDEYIHADEEDNNISQHEEVNNQKNIRIIDKDAEQKIDDEKNKEITTLLSSRQMRKKTKAQKVDEKKKRKDGRYFKELKKPLLTATTELIE